MSPTSELARAALAMGLWQYGGAAPARLVIHSDRGSQYSSYAFRALVALFGLTGSMSRAGCPTDNALCERLIGTVKDHCVRGRAMAPVADMIRRLRDCFELDYNARHRHSALDYLTPNEFAARAEGVV